VNEKLYKIVELSKNTRCWFCGDDPH